MAKVHGKNAGFVIDAFDLGSVASSSTIGFSVDTAETTTYSSAAKEYLEGDAGFTGSFTSFLDTGTDNWDDVSYSKFTTRDDDHYACWEAPTAGAAHTLGNVVYEGIVRWTGQPREFSVTDALIINGDLQGTDRASRGHVTHTGAITATGAKTGFNHGTTTATQTVVATFRVLSVSGSGSIEIDIEQSQNDGSPDAYAAIAALASGSLTAVGVTRKTTTAATETWKRINVTAFSGFTSVTILVTVTVAHA